MAIRISEESVAAATATIRDEHGVFESASMLPDLSLSDAPLATDAAARFTEEWNRAVSSYHDLLDAVETVMGVAGRALLALDEEIATPTPTGPGGPR